MRLIEVCCGTINDVVAAQAGGAIRVELCAALGEGGLTPSYGTITTAVRNCSDIKVNVIIRPRSGDFVYNKDEVAAMIEDIGICKNIGVNGVVIGTLLPDGGIDVSTCEQLINAAAGMSVTFHRAFDVCKDPMLALEQIIDLGCDRILTSGQAKTAEDGLSLIAKLVEKADSRIIVMPGCGITPDNVLKIERESGASEFHSTARIIKPAQKVYQHHCVSFGENQSTLAADKQIVAQLVNL